MWLGDVFDALPTERVEDDRQPGSDLITDRAGEANSPGLGQRLQPGGNINAVTKRFEPSTITSPRWTPMRNRICSPSERFAFSFAIASWAATAHSTASTALAKSAIRLSPAVLNIRPRWAAINRSRIARYA